MTTVRKIVPLNPVEASPLSFRAGVNVETTVDLTYYRLDGSKLGVDVDGQMHLTSRTSGRMTAYSVPATDIANGKARAVIPAGDVVEPNGYLLSLYGTVDGDAGLLASGTVRPDVGQLQSLGTPVDVIDTVPITLDSTLTTGSSFTVKLWDDEGKTDPYDLGSATIAAGIFAAQGGAKLLDMTVTPIASNSVTLSLTQDQVLTLPASCWWTLTIGTAGGATTLCQGPVTVI